jgi:HNH endonuclease
VDDPGAELGTHTVTEVRSTHRFDLAGQCIYCGSQEGLTDEHIIPLALNGNMILPKASCKDCSKSTSEFERQVLRGFMHDARLAAGFNSRRPKNQPRTIRVRLVDQDNNVTEVDVPRFEAPGLLMLPTFTLPSFLLGEPPVTGINIHGFQLVNMGSQGDLEQFVKDQGAAGLQVQSTPEIEALGQMLAKIAYSYAVAVTGVVDRESSPLPDIMRDRTNNGRWIGSDEFRLKSEDAEAIHALAHVPNRNSPYGLVDVVLIKLFANAGLVDGYVAVTRAPGWREYAS